MDASTKTSERHVHMMNESNNVEQTKQRAEKNPDFVLSHFVSYWAKITWKVKKENSRKELKKW